LLPAGHTVETRLELIRKAAPSLHHLLAILLLYFLNSEMTGTSLIPFSQGYDTIKDDLRIYSTIRITTSKRAAHASDLPFDLYLYPSCQKARVRSVRPRGPSSTDRDAFPEALHQCIEFDGTSPSKVYRT
jgi:hypothetical protein